jgi:hypothetical protein
MNTKIIAGIIAVVVVAGAAFFLTRPKPTSEVASNTNTAESATQASVETASIKSLIESGRSRMCTFKTVESGTESRGTVYVADGKMRGDFEVEYAGGVNVYRMIHTGSTSYMWEEGTETGFKMALDSSNFNTGDQNQSIDPNKNLEFNCESWEQDSSKFEIPTNINFAEMPTIPGNLNANSSASGSLNTKEVQQAMCNSLPEPAKSQCISAIK